MSDSKTPQDGKPASGSFIAYSHGSWMQCADELPPMGVYVVAVWDILGQTTVHIARRGVPGWYSKSGVEMVSPKFWIPLPENTQNQEHRMSDSKTPHDGKPASVGSQGDACREAFRRWAEETLPDAQENSVGECLDPRSSWAWQGWRAGQRDARLTDEEREAIQKLAPSGDPLASRVVTLTPDDRRIFFGLLRRLG